MFAVEYVALYNINIARRGREAKNLSGCRAIDRVVVLIDAGIVATPAALSTTALLYRSVRRCCRAYENVNYLSITTIIGDANSVDTNAVTPSTASLCGRLLRSLYSRGIVVSAG